MHRLTRMKKGEGLPLRLDLLHPLPRRTDLVLLVVIRLHEPRAAAEVPIDMERESALLEVASSDEEARLILSRLPDTDRFVAAMD